MESHSHVATFRLRERISASYEEVLLTGVSLHPCHAHSALVSLSRVCQACVCVPADAIDPTQRDIHSTTGFLYILSCKIRRQQRSYLNAKFEIFSFCFTRNCSRKDSHAPTIVGLYFITSSVTIPQDRISVISSGCYTFSTLSDMRTNGRSSVE